MKDNYNEFIYEKSQLSGSFGFEPNFIPEKAFPFQEALIGWATRQGRAAVFADCGLGKTMMQLAWCENVVRHTGGNVLLLCPLAVGAQTVAEAERFGMKAERSMDGTPKKGITVTNYEKLHMFNPLDFAGVCCDESSILKHVKGQTQKAVTRFMSKMKYRSLWTATAAPNDFTELGTSSEALGNLNHSEMLRMFFKQMDDKTTKQYERKVEGLEKAGKHFAKLSFRVSQAINGWRLKGHAHEHFWRWVASWSRACRKPSDLGFSDEGYFLPELIEREHVVIANEPPEGMLFTMPAFGLGEERDERKRTLKERCQLVAQLVNHTEPAVVWCHYNEEGRHLESIIPNSINVEGSDSDEFKEAAAEWFIGEKCICSDPMFRAKLAAWQTKTLPTSKKDTERGAKNFAKNQSNGAQKTKITENNTCGITTKKTQTNSSQPLKSLKKSKQPESQDITLTQNLGSESLTDQTLTELKTQLEGITDSLKNAEHHLPHMKMPLHPNQENAPYVVQGNQKIKEDTDCTLTIAMKPENTGGCYAHHATSESESLETITNQSCEPHCICGHLSGNRKIISKSKIFGFGQNWQHCNHVVTFASHSYEQYYQSVRRCYRFGQKRPVTVDIIASEGEVRVKENLDRKAGQADKMFADLVNHMNDAIHHKAERQKITATIPSFI
jgi:hypothetical protein